MGFGKKLVPLKYIKLIKNMYDGDVISVITTRGITSKFPILIGFHHGLTLNPYLFALVIKQKIIQTTYCV